ncbi:hypothetical protein HID58_050573 [Brassica napus]|uniref:Uncharacterized protein n=1 Tax=Brassica napus TaxID=3708 RepID=A0ABQ8A6R6_BRANA|nr:hypothetical protein HID58_050573 [Brassica napus]
MTDNIFKGLPPPSSQQQELSNSSNPNESKDESRSPAPTLVLKSSLKRSKPAESAPNVSDYVFELKKQNFDVVLTDLTKRSNLTAPPALKSALKRSNLRLNQNLSYLIAMLEAAMSSQPYSMCSQDVAESSVVCFISQCNKDCASVLQRELLESNVPDTTKSMDLISSLPHQTLVMCEESLRLAIKSQSGHVSVMNLFRYTPGQSPLPSETQSAEFYKTASSMLRGAGYEHYEVSSYSKDGFKCKHKPFYAFGLGSASYVGGLRFSRPRKLKEYTNYVADLENGAANWCGDGSVDLKDVAPDSGHIVCLDEVRREVMSDEFKKLVGNDEVKIEDHVRYLRRWDSVLSQVSQLKLHMNKLEDLYEQ